MKMKKHIAVVMGGTTSEHNISLKSGQVVIRHLPQDTFEVTAVIVSQNGWIAKYKGEDIPINPISFAFTYKNRTHKFDAVFNAIHGAPGENGELQTLLDNAQIPYTGCSAEVAKLTYNKFETLEFLAPHGVAMAKHRFVKESESWNVDDLIAEIGLPCFVKANKAGSSYGVVKVYETSQMQAAIETALKEDDEVLIERFLSGTEVSIGVITYQGEVIVLAPTEIISNSDFFDFQAKYEGNSQEITPARLSEIQHENLKSGTSYLYRFGCSRVYTQ